MDFKKTGIRLRYLETKQKHQSPNHKIPLPHFPPLISDTIHSEFPSCQTQQSEVMQMLNNKMKKVEEQKQTIQSMEQEIRFLKIDNKEKQREIDRLKGELDRERKLRENYDVKKMLPAVGGRDELKKPYEEEWKKVRQISLIEDTTDKDNTLSSLVSPLMALNQNIKCKASQPMPIQVSQNSEVVKFQPKPPNQPSYLSFEDFQFSKLASSQQSSSF